jgi:sarcosine oxidase subunit gamma
MDAASPTQHQRRSMLYRWHRRHDATFVEQAGAIVVADYAGNADEMSAAHELGLCDLSTLPRWGVTGRGATGWLEDAGFVVPGSANRAVCQGNGDLLARLSDNEYLMLGRSLLVGATGPSRVPDFSDAAADSVYWLPRQDSHAWFAVSGTRARESLATVCGVDLGEHVFADGAVAQTSVARVSAVLLRADLGHTPCFFVLGSSTSAEFVWDALARVRGTSDVTAVGIHALQGLSVKPA